MTAQQQVWISVYGADDPSSIQQRLEQAVAGFCGLRNIPPPPPEALVTARTDRGKPYFPHAPQLRFSISHSGRYWACAVAEQAVGFDLQQKERPRKETPEEMLLRHKKMAHRFFHPREAEFVDRDCANHFLTVWTAREAYVKHTGQGIDKYFSDHCVVPEDESSLQRISGQADEVQWTAMGKCFRKGYFDGDYAMCLCTDTPCDWVIQIF